MAKKKLQQCEVHKAQDLYYNDSFSTGTCIECVERKVDVLWERIINNKGKKK